MSEAIRLHFEIDDEVADPEALRSAIEEEIKSLNGIETSEVIIEELRTGVEIVTMIGAGIVIARSAKDAIDIVSDIVESLTRLVENMKGLKAALVDTDDGRKDIEALTNDEWQSLTEA